MPTNLSEYNIGGDQAQSCLFVGDSGTGKSIAAASYVREGDTRKVYFCSCDGRMGSVAEWHRGRTDVEFDIFTGSRNLKDKLTRLQDDCPYQTLVVDPITNISSFLMRESFKLRGVTIIELNEETGRVETKTSSKGKKKGDTDLTSYDDIAFEHRGIEDIILNMKIIQQDHNTTVILVGHLLTTQYKKIGGVDGATVREIVTAGKKIVPFIPTQFDEYYHFYADGRSRKVKTYNDGIVGARSSFLNMPEEIDWTGKGSFYDEVSKYYIPSEKKKKEDQNG